MKLAMSGLWTTLSLQDWPLHVCEPSQVCPKVIPPSLQSCPLLALLPRVIGLTYLFWLLWCVPSRPTFLVATCPGHKQPDQSPEPWTSLRVPLSHVGLGSTQLFPGTVPGWGGSVHLCGFYTNRCNMGAPLAQRKALVGEETWENM